jgi:hypothetical protein
MIARKFNRRVRRDWFWRFRRDGPPAIVEEHGDGWHVIVAGREVGVVASREIAEQLIDKIDEGTTADRRAKPRS